MASMSYDKLRHLMADIVEAYAYASREFTGHDKFSSILMHAMREVPRHEFVPEAIKEYAYADQPLPIGYDKTTSQPFIVALMVELLDIDTDDTVLEVGTGLGFQAAIMSRLASKVYSMEIIAELAGDARERLERLGFHNVEVLIGNGYYGLPDHAPFDKIVVAAAPEHLPSPLIEQLRPGGRMVVPVGPAGEEQQLVAIHKDMNGDVHSDSKLPVAFAPLVMVH